MADYFSPTVIQQAIPETDMTPLERLILTAIFDADATEEGLYFYSQQGPSDVVELPRAELQAALAASRTLQSAANALVAEQLAAIGGDKDSKDIELDLRATSWEFLFQSIVRRSAALRYITAITSYMCSKMLPDGFGGSALFITSDAIRGYSTHEFLADCLADIAGGPSVGLGASRRPGSPDTSSDGNVH